MNPASPRPVPTPGSTEAFADNVERWALVLMGALISGRLGLYIERGDMLELDRLDTAIAAYQRHRESQLKEEQNGPT